MKPHKHAELIKAWADGAEIQFYDVLIEGWSDCKGDIFLWNPTVTYRVKPEPKPDVVRYVAYEWNPENQNTVGGIPSNTKSWYANLKLTFDGETGKLKSAEVL